VKNLGNYTGPSLHTFCNPSLPKKRLQMCFNWGLSSLFPNLSGLTNW